MKPKEIARGELVKIIGFTKHNGVYLVVCEWTTGRCYVPYDLMKKAYPKQLIEYYKACSKFVKI